MITKGERLSPEVKKIIAEPKPKFIPEELEEEGYVPTGIKEAEISDKSLFEKQIIDRITVEQIFDKAKLDEREKNVLRMLFFDDMIHREVANKTPLKEDKTKVVSVQRVPQIESRALQKLRRFLPKSQYKELMQHKQRELAKALVFENLYPEHKNKFLIVEYLTKYFVKEEFREFSPDETRALWVIGFYKTREEVLERAKGWFGQANPLEAREIIDRTLAKVRRIVGRKFK